MIWHFLVTLSIMMMAVDNRFTLVSFMGIVIKSPRDGGFANYATHWHSLILKRVLFVSVL